jgi:nucleotide-binding universal stress UspA family protein
MIKFQRILCPTDLTAESVEAMRYAVALAHSYDAELILCYCAQRPASSNGGNGSNGSRRKHQIQDLFADAVFRNLGLAAISEVKWEGVVVEGSEEGDGITQLAAERGVDLIVMRSRRRPTAAALLGSTAEHVCRIAPCPVLVTHPNEREFVGFSTGEIDPKRILVAYDFSKDSEEALSYALSLAEEYQADLYLMHVLDGSPRDTPELEWGVSVAETAYHEASRYLHKTVPAETHLWCRVVNSVRWGKPYAEILMYAEEHKIDLICMGASGAGFGVSSLFGSNVDRVLRQAPCPVLVVRPINTQH